MPNFLRRVHFTSPHPCRINYQPSRHKYESMKWFLCTFKGNLHSENTLLHTVCTVHYLELAWCPNRGCGSGSILSVCVVTQISYSALNTHTPMTPIKGTVHPKMKIQSLSAHRHADGKISSDRSMSHMLSPRDSIFHFWCSVPLISWVSQTIAATFWGFFRES